MFPLNVRKISGFVFKQLYPKSFGSLYNHPHLGVDYHCDIGTSLYAPFNGTIRTLWGTEGGNTIWFYPDNQNVIIRFMHLSAFKVGNGNKVKEGDLIALTGNTGSATNAPHLHLDISKVKVDIYNINNFIDPEKYAWVVPSSPKMEQSKITPELQKSIEQVNTPVTVQNTVTSDYVQPQSISEQQSITNVQIPDLNAQKNIEKVQKQILDIIQNNVKPNFWDKSIELIINFFNKIWNKYKRF